MITWINDQEHLRKISADHSDYFVLVFWGAFSDATQLLGMAPGHMARPARKKALRVTVYTSPGCPACGHWT